MTPPFFSNLYKEYDNPGNNDCGFYSFANGLAAVIQREIANGNNNPRQLELLNQYRITEQAYTAEQFVNYSYNFRKRNDRQFLENLKIDLRNILYNQYINEICRGSVIIEGLTDTIRKSAAYMWFMEIFYFYYQRKPFDKEMNLLCLSPAVRRYAADLANKFRAVTNAANAETLVQDHFLLDLFGENHFTHRAPWSESLANYGEADLTPKAQNLVSTFKQFRMIAEDYYNADHTDRLVDPDFEFGNEAHSCAKAMRRIKAGLRHTEVKIVVGNNPLSNEHIIANTLYFQINEETHQIQVYSPYLEQGYPLHPSKADNIFAIIRRSYPNFVLKANNEISIAQANQRMFKQLASIANDTFNEQLIFKIIAEHFLALYPEQESDEISKLINSTWADSLSYDTKEELRTQKGLELVHQLQPNSIIKRALAKLTTRQWLATHQDLKYLAELFEVHLDTLENGVRTIESLGQNSLGRPTITVNNINNFHWTTRVQIGYLAGEDASKYADWSYKNLPLTKEEIKSLLLSYTNGFKAFFGRTHREKAGELIALCDNEESTVAQIMDNYREYMYAQQYKPDSSFLKRFEYLDARERNFKNDSFNKRDIERVFANYAYTGYYRHHRQQAHTIIGACKNPEMSLGEVYQLIQTYVQNTEFNHNSAFRQCWQKIRELHEYSEEQQQLRLLQFN